MEDLSRQADIPIDAIGASAGTVVLKTKVNGDSAYRFNVTHDGTLAWGSGSGAVDVQLARADVGAVCIGRAPLEGLYIGVVGSALDILEVGSLPGYTMTIGTNNDRNVNIAVGGGAVWTFGDPLGGGSHFYPAADNVGDIGTSSFRVRNIRWGTQALSASGSVGVPGFAFSAFPTNGYYSVSTNSIGVTLGGAHRMAFTKRFTGDGLVNDGDAAVLGTGLVSLRGSTANESLDLGWYKFGCMIAFRSEPTRAPGGLSAVEFHSWRQVAATHTAAATIAGTDGFNAVQVRDLGDTNGLVVASNLTNFSIYTENNNPAFNGDYFYFGVGGLPYVRVNADSLRLESDNYFAWSAGGVDDANDRVRLYSAGVGILEQKNGTAGQTFRVYGTTTGPAYTYLSDNGSYGTLGVQSASEYLQIAFGASETMNFDSLGLFPNVDNVQVLGSDIGPLRFATIYMGSGSAATPSISLADGATGFYEVSGTVVVRAINSFEFCPDGSYTPTAGFTYDYPGMDGGCLFLGAGSDDVVIGRVAADVLGMARSDNNQTFRVYGKVTGPKYLSFTHTDSFASISTFDSGLGINPSGSFIALGVGAATQWQYEATLFYPSSDNAYDIGKTANRVRGVYVASFLSVGTTPAATGYIRIPNDTTGNGLIARNNANNGDIVVIGIATVNAVVDVVKIGPFSSGVQMKARSGAGAPSTSDIPTGEWCLWRDTSGGTTKVYYNNAGAIQSVTLT